MKKIIIFANGNKPKNVKLASSDEIILAADGGARHCRDLDITPDFIIGDFDSLPIEDINYFKNRGVKFIRHPSEKDETDLELALNHAFKIGASDIDLYGLFGGRWEMSFANLLLLASPKYSKFKFRIIDNLVVVQQEQDMRTRDERRISSAWRVH